MKPTNQPTSHPANILKAQYAFGKAGHNVNDRSLGRLSLWSLGKSWISLTLPSIRIELHNNYTGQDRTGRTVRTGRDSSNERVHIALEWAEDVDGLERGLEGFGLDDD
ncbi:hypothetical protein BTUL_0168g00220 [Botrytis tulipae]|uniref:Uncharacterized protein n=1 Tax=Botrytis tulipae TaxID=87230 RepID=A0A4Z1EAT5_9HELO|nr:hypothetical protein BTUL_0168g00220 [Botrytis tulipae]